MYRRKKVPCLVFETCRNHDLVSALETKGYRVYYLRHDDNDWSHPITLEESVSVNFFGYMAVNQIDADVFAKELFAKGYLRITYTRLDLYACDSVFKETEIPLMPIKSINVNIA